VLRALIHHRAVTLAVAAGAAVTTAVLAGALVVGDSVRESLRVLALERLGRIELALAGQRFFRPELARGLGADAAALIEVVGSAVHARSSARASSVDVHGVPPEFARLFDAAAQLEFAGTSPGVFPPVIVNAALAVELGAAVGDDVVLSFARTSDVPRATLMGDKDPEDLLGTLRVSVAAVLPDAGPGEFGLVPGQRRRLNAFVPRERLARALGQPGRANTIVLAGGGSASDAGRALGERLELEDLGLHVDEAAGHLRLSSADFVLRPDVERVALDVLGTIGAVAQPVQAYLATEMRLGERAVPYSTVAGVDALDAPEWAALEVLAGELPRPLPADRIVLNAWAARELGASPGDRIELDYFEVGPREELLERTTSFEVAAIVALAGLAADGGLVPDYPGIQDAADMAGWDPPFPVDLSRVGARDEEYWDAHRALPKAFVGYAAAGQLWSTRFGSASSIRCGPAPGADLAETRERVRRELRARLDPAAFGFVFADARGSALASARGATDFGGLFLGFSMFLIVSAALLVGLLFGLGVERRAGEIGLLLAVGYPVSHVRRRMLGEGAVTAIAGVGLGLPLAVGYAALMMVGLRTIWLPAVGSSRLELHVLPASLGIGAAAAFLVVLLAIATRVARLSRVPPARLLAGSLAVERRRGTARVSLVTAVAAAVLALVLLGQGLARGRLDDAATAFGAGALLLVAGLAAFDVWCRSAIRLRRGVRGGRGLRGMAARNAAWNPGRSMLSVALVACACFVIVTVAANRGEYGDELRARESGSGGFALLAETRVPLYQDLDDPEDLAQLGFDDAQIARLAGKRTVPLRLLPGEDASCLNLYRPTKPRVLGVPDALVDRGGFGFRQSTTLPPGARSPWDLLAPDGSDAAVPAIGDFNSTQWILHLPLGGEIELPDERGRPLPLRLVATLDGSVFQSELLIAESAFLERFPSHGGFSYFLIDAPPGAEQGVAEELERGLAPFGFDVTTTRERLLAFKAVEHTYLATFQLLGGLGLLLGTVGLAIVLLRNVVERRGELATLRAFGFRRSRIAAMILAENAFLLLGGMAVGSGAALVTVLPRLAAIDVPWRSIAATLVVVLIVGLLASLAAVRGALRAPLLPALKAER
jgi:ABC-type lipoprotein release transport system permease subunit